MPRPTKCRRVCGLPEHTVFGPAGQAHTPAVTMTVDEANEYASLFNDIDSYMKEQISLFIQGKRSLDEYPEYRATLESMGIERMIELEQAAYDRYMAR